MSEVAVAALRPAIWSALCALFAGLSGCAVVGPQAISAGRGVYAEVINRTEDEQVLNVIVRMRYDETFGMMSVASVTANLRFRAQTEAQIGIGESENYVGNLIPFSAGVGYEENPTISYLPLSGEDFMRRMLSPVTIEEWLLLSSPLRHPGRLFELAIHRANGLKNPLLGLEPTSPEFVRLIELFDHLRWADVLDTVQIQGAEKKTRGEYFWDFHDYDEHADSVRELLGLLGIEAELDGSPLLLPLRQAVGTPNGALHLESRSAYQVLGLFGAGIELPPAHVEAGIVEPLAFEVSEERQFITIRSSKKRPDNATVRVRFRDRWFYVDASDTKSKRAFLFLRTFIGMRLADERASQRAPLITVPVN